MARILFVSTSTTLGGAEKTLFSLATSLGPVGHETAGVVSLKPEGLYAQRLREKGIAVESLGLTRPPLPGDVARLGAIIAREKPDIVHALMYQAIQLCRLAKPGTTHPFKLVSSPRVHYRTRSWWTLLLDRRLKSRDDLLISECEVSRRFLLQRQGYAPSMVAVIRNGVEIPEASGNRAEKRAELGLNPTDILVGAIGRLDRQKGIADLIRAMARLKETPLHCAILGDGPERKTLEGLIRAEGLEKKARLLGERADAASWLSAFDLYCLPSLWEGLPNSLLEAMARGLPVVASNVDGVPEAVSDGKDGILVPPRDPNALAAALSTLAKDPARRAALGAAAKRTAAERFTLRRMIGEYARVYSDLARH